MLWIIIVLLLLHIFYQPKQKKATVEEPEDFTQAKADAGPPRTVEEAMDRIAAEMQKGDD